MTGSIFSGPSTSRRRRRGTSQKLEGEKVSLFPFSSWRRAKLAFRSFLHKGKIEWFSFPSPQNETILISWNFFRSSFSSPCVSVCVSWDRAGGTIRPLAFTRSLFGNGDRDERKRKRKRERERKRKRERDFSLLL